MASLYKKTINGRPYWYLREMARVDGKPKMVSERYLGTAADVEALLDAREEAVSPARTRHLGFGDVAAVWGFIDQLGVIDIIDAAVGSRRADAGASVGTYLALAALNRLVDPCSKRGFADWWKTTAGDRFTRIPASVMDHRKFWEAMHAFTTQQMAEVEQQLALRMVEVFDLDIGALALDMTNFATYIDSTNDRAPIAQRGKAKQKRNDLRLVGLGLVVTRDGGIPLVAHTYAGNRPDVTQFADMIDLLITRHQAIAEDAGQPATAEVTVVFDAGQNSITNFTHLADSGLGFVGSVPPSDCPDLRALPTTARSIVDAGRFGGLTACETTRTVYGHPRRTVLTHSPTLHAAQARGFDQSLTQAETTLALLADKLARGKTRRGRTQVNAEITQILHDTWTRRVIDWQLSGENPKDLRLTFTINPAARDSLEEEIFGKRVLITNRDSWSIAEIVAGYRSQSEVEFSFRQLKDPHVVSFSPMHHFTEHTIRVHVFTSVLALQLAHLMRRHAHHHGQEMSVRELLNTLAGIEETVLIYPSTGGRPKARRMLTETTKIQDQLINIFDLNRWAPTT